MLMKWLFNNPVGFFDKTNPEATIRSTAIWSVVGAIVGAAAFFIINPHPSRESCFIWLPLWIVLNAVIAGLIEWQID
jgi:hypothetical protein